MYVCVCVIADLELSRVVQHLHGGCELGARLQR